MVQVNDMYYAWSQKKFNVNLMLKYLQNYTGEDIYGMGTENTGFLL